MLTKIFTTRQGQLRALADSWLNAGATAFGVRANGRLLLSWPLHASLEEATLTAPIRLGNSAVGELQVTGIHSRSAEARLQAEAGLVSQLLDLERDIESMTAELIDTQDQLLALYDLTHATRNYLDVEQILHRFAYEITQLLNVEGAFAVLDMPNNFSIIKHYPEPILDDNALKQYFSIVQRSRETILRDGSAKTEMPPAVRNFLMIPIEIRGVTVAALGLVNKNEGAFTSPDLKLTQAIAEHAGARIETALLYQESLRQTRLQTEMEMAHRVQINLLPQRPPQVSGLDLWASSRPASQVGGDFYDFSAKPGRPFTFTVGDISGKGMPAALLMAMTRAVTRNKTNTTPAPTPQIVIGSANEDMYDDFTEVSMFATMFVGQYMPDHQKLLYANAGHSPVIYCPLNSPARLLEADGTALGVFPTSLSEDQQLHFQPGDVLVVGTDGLNEARNAKEEMFGYDRLVNLAKSVAHLPAQAIGDLLYRAVNEFSGNQPQDDDQTVVVLKGTPAE